MSVCAAHGAAAIHQGEGRPRSRFYEIAHRVAGRFEPAVAASFAEAVARLQRQVDAAALRSAVASGDPNAITAAISTGGTLSSILEDREMERALQRTATVTGRAGADVLTGALDVQVQFNALAPDVVLFARQQAGNLIVQVSDDVREAVRIVLTLGQVEGLTTAQQARAIREVVGLPPNWAAAPGNLYREILDGQEAAATARRLSATDKAQIRSRIARGTANAEFAEQMRGRYARSLVNRRARNIARTETLRASHHGQRIGWKQALGDGHLPDTTRRVWIVTPDDRLEHWMVPAMNEGGRGVDEMFDTPEGPVVNPPSRPNCRCGVGLMFPGRPGVL